MTNFFISLGLGLAAAAIDVGPMLVRKLDRTFVLSAFCMWVALGILIPAARIVPIGWLNGIIVALLCAIPVVCLVVKLDRPAIPVMLATTVVLGAGVGFLSGLLIK